MQSLEQMASISLILGLNILSPFLEAFYQGAKRKHKKLGNFSFQQQRREAQ